MKFEQKLDVRSQELCEPQTAMLDAAARLPAGYYLHILHRMEPKVLLHVIMDKGFDCRIYFGNPDVPVELFIWRKEDNDAWQSLLNDFKEILHSDEIKLPTLPILPELPDWYSEHQDSPLLEDKTHPLISLNTLNQKQLLQLQLDAAQQHNVAIIFSDTLKDNTPGPDMVVIPAGKSSIGDMTGHGGDNEKPAYEAVITHSFALGRYPITVKEFMYFTEVTGYKTQAEQEGAVVWQKDKWEKNNAMNWRNADFISNLHYPVVFISWFDVIAYCQWLSTETKRKYRLPTEIEWEYAARAGSEGDWCFGNDVTQLNDYAWYQENAQGHVHPSGEKKANVFGLYDMHGNVGEWTSSHWKDYDKEKVYDVTRIVRGGAWDNSWRLVRAAHRCMRKPIDRNALMGFRIAVTI